MDNDRVVKDEVDINTEAINYFCQWGPFDDGDEDPHDLMDCIAMLVSPKDNTAMTKKVDSEEVRLVAFSFQGFKSLGSNGFPQVFF